MYCSDTYAAYDAAINDVASSTGKIHTVGMVTIHVGPKVIKTFIYRNPRVYSVKKLNIINPCATRSDDVNVEIEYFSFILMTKYYRTDVPCLKICLGKCN